MWYDARMTENEREKFCRSYVLCNGCWLWIRGLTTMGYGICSIEGKARRAHRVSYEMVYGVTLTPDQFLHHVCGVKSCVNPMHLEITNQVDHVDSATHGNKNKTHCPHGHEYTLENICWNKSGRSRECRTCKYARTSRRTQRIKAEERRNRKLLNERLGEIIQKYEREGRWPVAPPDGPV